MRIARRAVFALAAAIALWTPMQARAQVAVGISVQFGPPALPVYDQPICPGDGYIWTPGYWAYSEDDGYYWVPGTWVLAPVGMLWTPGYWAWQNDAYAWYPGYWVPEVGFYGGVYYGFGYTGVGYEGGYWGHRAFYYNRSVNNVANVTSVYNKTVVNNVTVNNVSYNGGPGGTNARPTPAQLAAARAPHTPPTDVQVQHERAAGADRSQFASVNHGKPGVAATARPGEFSAKGVVAAKAAAPYKAPPKSVGKPEQPNRPATEPTKSNPANPRAPVATPENPGKSANPQPNSKEGMKRQQNQQEQQEQNQKQQQQIEEQRQKQIEQQQRNSENERKQQNQNMEQQRPPEQPKAQPKPQPAPQPKPEEKPQSREEKKPE